MNRATFDSDADLASRNAFVGGLSFLNPLSATMAFQLDILYSMKGAKSNDPSSNSSATLKFNYLSFPAMIRAEFPAAGRIRAFLHGGAAFDFRLSCSGDATFAGQKETATCDQLAEELSSDKSFSRFDWGPVLGGGVAFDVGSRTLSLGARYEIGMRDIAAGGKLKNRTLSFIASMEAPVPRK